MRDLGSFDTRVGLALTLLGLVLIRSGLVLSRCTHYVVSLMHEYVISKHHFELINQLAIALEREYGYNFLIKPYVTQQNSVFCNHKLYKMIMMY